MLAQEKRNIYDQISAADELKKQQQDLTQRLKSQLTLFSIEEIERRIKNLEHQQQVHHTRRRRPRRHDATRRRSDSVRALRRASAPRLRSRP